MFRTVVIGYPVHLVPKPACTKPLLKAATLIAEVSAKAGSASVHMAGSSASTKGKQREAGLLRQPADPRQELRTEVKYYNVSSS